MASNVVARRLAASMGQMSQMSSLGRMTSMGNMGLKQTPNAANALNSAILSNNSLMTQSMAPSMMSAQNFQQTRQYHETVIDHFNKPRNVGKLDAKKKSVGSAIVGKASCGDVIKLQIEVEEGKIKDAKFKTFGCGSAIASSSLATEMIIGQDVGEAAKLRNTDISSHLNLPPVKIHCSVLAEEAIQAAIKDYKTKNNA